MKRHSFTLLAICLLMGFTSFAQKGGRNIYNWSLGLKAEAIGESTDIDAINLPTTLFGPAFKFLIDPQKSIEIAALSDYSNGVQGHAIFNFFNPFPEIPQNYRYYFGLGVHAGRWSRLGDSFRSGLDGQIGIEFIGRKIPVALSVDWHPTVDLITESSTKLWPVNFGVTLKYTYKR